MHQVYTYKPQTLTTIDLEALEIGLVELSTRRRFIIGAGGLLGAAALGACGASEEAMAPTATTGGTRIFRNADGSEVEIPANPQRVVTLQDQNALLPLWELGFRNIVGSTGAVDENGNPYFRRMAEHGFEPNGVEFVGSHNEPTMEVITQLNPDLIVGMPNHAEIYDLLSEIAPTVLIDRSDGTLREVMLRYGELVGLEDEVERLEVEYQQGLTDLRTAAGDPSEIVISKIETAAGGGAAPGQFYISQSGVAERIMREVGFARPAPQLAVEERTFFSVEVLPQHDADLLIRIVTGHSADEEENTQAVKGSPLWAQLNATQKGQAVDVSGGATFGTGYSPSMYFINTLIDLLEGLDTSGDLSSVEVAIPTAVEE